MNKEHIRQWTAEYLEALQCGILETSPAHMTVKLSPEADKDLTNRHYYWSFVERTGAEPETMTYTFIFDKEKYEELQAADKPTAHAPDAGKGSGAAGSGDSILGRNFGYVPPIRSGRIPAEILTYGSGKLQQIVRSAHSRGRYVCLFEEPEAQAAPGQRIRAGQSTVAYSPWLCLNALVEYACDRKRSELHSLAINLISGEIRNCFYDQVKDCKLTPRMPPHTHIRQQLVSLDKAASLLENHLQILLQNADHEWAEEAFARLGDELDQIKGYYEPLLASADEEAAGQIAAQYEHRTAEIEWQYRPRIEMSAINCGIFHLHSLK